MNHNSSNPNPNPTPSNDNLGSINYGDNLIAGAIAITIGLVYKGVMRREITPVTSFRKVVETFLVVAGSSFLGTQIADKLRKDGYLEPKKPVKP